MSTETIEQIVQGHEAMQTPSLYQRLATVTAGVGTIRATGKTAQGAPTLSIVDVEDALRLLLAKNGVITGYRWNALPTIVGQEGKLTLWQADLTVWIRSTDSEELLEDRICDIGSSPSAAVSFALKRYYRALFHLADTEDETRSASIQPRTGSPARKPVAPAVGTTPPPPPAPAAGQDPGAVHQQTKDSAHVMRRLKDAITASGLPREQIQSLSQTLFGQSDSKALSLEQLEKLAEELEGIAQSRGPQV